MSIENIGSMKKCDHAEYRRIYDKYKDRLTVFSSYSGGIIGMPQMSTAWGIKGNETALIASECENWERRWEDPEAWTYWKNADLVAALEERDAMCAALKASEWHPADTKGLVKVCLRCKNVEQQGHAPDCIIGIALREAEGGGE